MKNFFNSLFCRHDQALITQIRGLKAEVMALRDEVRALSDRLPIATPRDCAGAERSTQPGPLGALPTNRADEAAAPTHTWVDEIKFPCTIPELAAYIGSTPQVVYSWAKNPRTAKYIKLEYISTSGVSLRASGKYKRVKSVQWHVTWANPSFVEHKKTKFKYIER